MESMKRNGPIVMVNLPNLNGKIYIQDYFTDTNQQIIQELHTLKSSHDTQYVWFKHGPVWARQSSNSRIHLIGTLNDFTNLKQQLNPDNIQSTNKKSFFFSPFTNTMKNIAPLFLNNYVVSLKSN